MLVTAAVLVGEGVTLTRLLPPAAALTDIAFFGTVLVVMAVRLLRGNTRQEYLVAALQEQLTVDSLTGQATRRAFDEALETALSRSVPGVRRWCSSTSTRSRASTTPTDTPSVTTSIHLATVLRGRVRAEDAVLSRLGGDELTVLLPGCDRPTAAHRAQELLDAVRSTPMTLSDGILLALSISVGVAHLLQSSSDRRGLYTAADGALYEAKRAGRGCVSVAAV